MSDENDFDPTHYPSISLAYHFVLPTYDWALRRLESIERRIDLLARTTITIALAAPASAFAITRLSGKTFHLVLDESAYIAIAASLIAVVWGLFVRQAGCVSVIDLRQVYDKYLHKSQGEFQKDIIYTASEHAIANERLSRLKSYGADVMIALFIIEIVAVINWAFGALGL